MLFRVFELRPELPAQTELVRIPNGVSNRVIEGYEGKSYSVIIGTKDRNPTSRTKERIRQMIREAWGGLFDSEGVREKYGKWEINPPPYGLAIVHDSGSPNGDIQLSPIRDSGFYIIFALLDSESNPSEEEERATHAELLQMITNQYSEVKQRPRIALVTLYNCSVQVLEGPGRKEGDSRNSWARGY